MTRFWLVLIGFLFISGPMFGQPVRVTSGEHEGFTRLVFDYGEPVDWVVGRDSDGYVLHLNSRTASYDLSSAFNLIGKSRLAAISAAPDTGDIRLSLACACHALPFEFRPGIVVLDLKDGPPPAGSAFENTLAPAATGAPPVKHATPPAPEAAAPPAAIAKQSYVWTDAFQGQMTHSPAPKALSTEDHATAETILPPDPGLQPLRETILQQMARGASQGVVEMTPPTQTEAKPPTSDFPSAQIRLGDAPMSVTKPNTSVHADIGAEGAACVPDAELAVAEWGDESQSLADQLAMHRGGLSGEFDKPNLDAVEGAVKFHIFLGFGVEASQLLTAFDVQGKDAHIWRALAQIVDGQADTEGAFLGQTACAGAAALWAVLSDDTATDGKPINTSAVRLAFSALPIHLRRNLGPLLAEKFLMTGDEETARALTAAISRAPGDAGNKVGLVEAEIDLHAGNAEKSERRAADILQDPGPDQPEALITYIKARITQGLPVAPKVALELQAHLADNAGSSLEKPLNEALILAQAASGAFEAALEGLHTYPEPEAEVWSLAAHLAPDETFLSIAVLDPASPPPRVSVETATAIATRLASFGLGGPARDWLAGVEAADPLLLAQTALNQGDGRAALAPLANAEDAEAQALRLQALSLIGEDRARAAILRATGDIAGASAALARAGDWQDLAQSGDASWKPVAEKLAETPMSEAGADGLAYGPLARGHDLTTAGEATRKAIEHLLQATPISPLPPENKG